MDPNEITFAIDISKWEEDPDHPERTSIDFQRVYDAGFQLVVSKATDGIYGRNAWFPKQREACAKVNGLLFSAFHWFKNQQDPAKQLKNFLDYTDHCDGMVPPWLDVEDTEKCEDPALTRKTLGGMAWELRRNIGASPYIYTGSYFWDRYVAPFAGIDLYPLIEAEYPNGWASLPLAQLRVLVTSRKPTISADWRSLGGWQFTDRYKVPGLWRDGCCDADVIYLSYTKLRSMIIGSPSPSLPIPPEVHSCYVVSGPLGGANVRSGPATTYACLRWLANGTKVTAYSDNGSWVKISATNEEWVYKTLLRPDTPTTQHIYIPLVQR